MGRVMRKLNILIACEESQAECQAFRELGHNAFSCDLQKAKVYPGWHIMGDVTPLLAGRTKFETQNNTHIEVPGWDLIIAHPPCTYLSKVSSVWMVSHGEDPPIGDGWYYSVSIEAWLNIHRYRNMIKAREFFLKCLNADAPFVAVENPIPMALAKLPRPSCYVCPSWFGVKYTKKTLYWLKNLPPVFAEIDYPNPKEFVKASRGKYRSRTFPQLAKAIAKQWSNYILDNI